MSKTSTGSALKTMAAATAGDYKRDPTRWGSEEIAAHFSGFEHLDVRTNGAVIRLRHGGSGPPLLLVHGNPQNHTCWYKIAARLAKQYHVILPDLRGYGDSSLPEPGPDHVNFSFRSMPSTLSSAATKCISEVPGFVKQTCTPLFTSVRTKLSAPFIGAGK